MFKKYIMDRLKLIFMFIDFDFTLFISRRFDVISNLLYVLVQIMLFGVFAELVNLKYNLSSYGVSSYLQFFIIGLIVHNLLFLPTGSVSNIVLSPKYALYHVSPRSIFLIIVASNIWRLIWNSILVSIMIAIYILCFGLVIHITYEIFILLALGWLITISLDLFSSGFRLVTKARQDPLNWFFNLTSELLSGLYFPVEALPHWLEVLSRIHPERYLLELSRKSLGAGLSILDSYDSLLYLVCLSLFTLFIGYITFRWGLNKTLELGTLGHT